jgi:hypothetical protein
MKIEDLFNELLEKYRTAGESAIWERSISIDWDLKKLEEEINEYKKKFQEALRELR